MSEESKEAIPASNEASVSTSETPVAKAPVAPEAANADTQKSAVEAQSVQAAAPLLTGDKPAAAAIPAAPAAAKPAVAAKPAAPAAAKPAASPGPKSAPPKPEPWSSELVRSLTAQYGSGIREASVYAGQKYLVVDSSLVYEILCRMRDDQLFDYCVDVTAVHYPKREAQFDIVYILYSFHNNERLRIEDSQAAGRRGLPLHRSAKRRVGIFHRERRIDAALSSACASAIVRESASPRQDGARPAGGRVVAVIGTLDIVLGEVDR